MEDCEALDLMSENAKLPENLDGPAQGAKHSVKDSAADFLREYIGVLNSAESNMSKDTGKKFAAGLHQKYMHEQRQ